MGSSEIESMHQDIIGMKKDLQLIKNILLEEHELSDEAKKELTEARNEKEFSSHEKIMKKFG
jgi:hypothetical protein